MQTTPYMKVDCYVLLTPAITNYIRIRGYPPAYSYSLASQMSTYIASMLTIHNAVCQDFNSKIDMMENTIFLINPITIENNKTILIIISFLIIPK